MAREFDVNDDLGYIVRRWNEIPWAKPSWTLITGEVYNPETHDLIPKKSFLERQLSLKEEELKTVKQQQEHTNQRFEIQKQNIKNEIADLKKKLAP
jgi:hypothetical protein